MSEWKEYKLGNLCDVRDGTHDSPKEVLYGKKLITSKNIKFGKIDFDSCYNISLEDYNKVNKRSQVDKYDVLFTMIGTIGETVIVDFTPDFAIKNIGLFKTNGNKDLAKWIYYFLKSNKSKAEISASIKGSTQEYISLGDLRNFPILLPPLPEQKAIASVLGSLDDKIDLLHRQNTTLEQMAETLFRQWFIEEAKEDWEVRKLGEEFDFIMGASPPGESYNEESNGIPMYQGNADFGFRFPINRVFTTDPKRYAEQNDTLISVRAPVGAQNMAIERCCIGRGVAAFRYKKDNSYYSYTYYKLKSLMTTIHQFNETGTVFGSISKQDFENIDVITPELNLIKKFQNVSKPIDDKITYNCFQINTLSKLRDTLLPKLMSGEVRVRE
jgi:type I restriction enzyme S subunit